MSGACVPARRPDNLLLAGVEVAAAATLLATAYVAVRALPFGLIAARVQAPLQRRAAGEAESSAIARVKWAVAAASRRLPWTVPCLATALAANRLLAWRGVASELWLGVKADDSSTLAAHAWLAAGGRVVTGGEVRADFKPLHALVTSPATAR